MQSTPDDGPWRIWVDTGGTFTDGVARSPAGETRRVKVLSTGALRGVVAGCPAPDRIDCEPGRLPPIALGRGTTLRWLARDESPVAIEGLAAGSGELRLSRPLVRRPAAGEPFEIDSGLAAPLLAAHLLTGTPVGQALPRCSMRLATTLGTNALLERAGRPTALFVTRGFADVLRIGTQQRAELFALDVRCPEPLHAAVIEVDERLDARGEVVRPLDADSLEPAARDLLRRGIDSAAVALLHSYRCPAHERRLADRLIAWGFMHVSCSAEIAPRIKLHPRAETAVIDAHLAPLIGDYLEQVGRQLGRGRLLVMTSAGGLIDADSYRPKDSLLSGPAGGVVGAAQAGRGAGCDRVIGFDMGGTSTDVARFDGDFEYVDEHRVGDARLVAPALAIETVAAGGGSVCWLDGERLRVGPQSAGARPGPACYGDGGPLTLTDVNLLLGRLDAGGFEIPIDRAPARRRLDELLDALTERTGERPPDEELLEGLVAIADEMMADAIRRVSLRRGYDPGDYALVAFGGAGGQHACGVAHRLDIARIVVPPDAAVLSAHGLGVSVVERFAERQVLETLDACESKVAGWIDALGAEAAATVRREAEAGEEIVVRRRSLQLRYAGQDATLDIEWQPGRPIAELFRTRYLRLFGHEPERRPIELESIRVVASTPASTTPVAGLPRPAGASAIASGEVETRIDGVDSRLPLYRRGDLGHGTTLRGPAVVRERHSTVVVGNGWRGKVVASGALVLERFRPARDESVPPIDGAAREAESSPEAVRLELFTQRFSTLVYEMGERLERTAVSTNVKERLDFSCALLDPTGSLVVNAPHIPVHLGALGACVRSVAASMALKPGDVVVTNHPASGGSHLPDVTVITPVFAGDGGGPLLGYVANRAHHAEIGGSRPGSMPPDATTLAEEGVVLPPMLLLAAGEARWDAVVERLTGGPYPTRRLEDNLADLRAATAANHAGAVALRDLCTAHGVERVLGYMERLQRLAEARMREALRAVPDGLHEASERLDDGTPIAASIEVRGDRARIDFSGTGAVHPGNLNATEAIVRSAVLYVLRLMLRRPLPLNEGLLRPVTIEIQDGLLRPPFPDDPRLAPAVVGGNVETSQRIVDTLLKALGLAACSQGTMNNVVFGNPEYGYYETLGGGCGAGESFHGASAVHSHMTNTRITDAEVLEHRYPVRVERFAIRHGSGGGGRWRGGDGLIRELCFLEPAELSLLTQHRTVAPYGLAGGADGTPGGQRVVRRSGETVELGSIDGCRVESGDRLIVETPGGGGYGSSSFGCDPPSQPFERK